ncbi:MAG TPA: SDR family oxidoreductase [Candidatus Latescibacteria bacterium]|jgi:NAD(P)-dependent dehydrogenase (short-subunit alcohol dehydrogenase family)|nr:SDR family oxidoreductase [Candidatus Handelsmanbacteria bacterium]HIL10633.1 SDR family oxidoreductase [Candidatus Latescibacterota bacterium]
MIGRVENKIALVTGGGSGLGRATVQALAREGAKVLVADLNLESAHETVTMVAETGGEASAFAMDVTVATQVEAMVQTTVERYGRLDCAFNNAGIPGKVGTSVIDYEEEDWDRVIAVDLKGVWLGMKYELKQMLKQGSGVVVNTASIAGLVGLVGSSPYVASKHGVVGLTKTAALEFAQQNIRVNAVCPGVFRTPLVEKIIAELPEREELYLSAQPIGRMGRPEELAEAVVWLCSDAASFVTGHAFPVDGGYVAG